MSDVKPFGYRQQLRKALRDETLKLESGSFLEQWWYNLMRAQRRERQLADGTVMFPALDATGSQRIVRNIELGKQGANQWTTIELPMPKVTP